MLAPYLAMTEGMEQIDCKFRFKVNSTSDPDFLFPSSMSHVVSDVTRADVGEFVVQFALGHRWPALVGGTGHVMSDSGVGFGALVQFTVEDYDAAAGTLTLRVVDPYSDGTPAAAEPTDNDWIYLDLVFMRRTQFSSEVAI